MATAPETRSRPAGTGPKVSVFVLTYNHANWIAHALDSALAQETTFEYELLVADDCSTDGTREIVAEYVARHPRRIRTYLPERNLGVVGIWLAAARRCEGELVAILEGDDYWTSPHKLAAQVALLDSHPSWSSCFHRATLFHDDGRQPSRPATPAFDRDVFGIEDVIQACFIPFLTVMFRRDVLRDTPAWLFSYAWFDWLFHIWCARRGPIGFLDEDMAAYRVHDRGNWSARDRKTQLRWDLDVYERLSRELPDMRALIERCVVNRRCQLAVEAAGVPAETAVVLLDAGEPAPATVYFNGRNAAAVGIGELADVLEGAPLTARMTELLSGDPPSRLHYESDVRPSVGAGDRTWACVAPRGVDAELVAEARAGREIERRGRSIWSDTWCRIWELDVDSALATTPGKDGTAEKMGALVEIAEVSLAEPTERALRGGFVDEPKAGAVLDTRCVDVLGWALGADRRALAAEFAIDGEVFWRAPLRAARPDLASAFPDRKEAGTAGFRTTLNLIGTPAEFELQVSIVLKGQERVSLARIRGRHRWRRDRSPAFAELVSVVIPCYRQAQYLGEAIESVLGQSYPHLEVLVVDDGSSDNASRIASRYPGVRCVREQNVGVAAARNAGIRATNGDFLVFLDADDRLLPDAIATGVQALERRPECAAAIGAYRRISHDGLPLNTHSQPAVTRDQYAQLMRENWAGFPARAIYRRSLFEHVRGFDPSVNGTADFSLNLAVVREFPICSHETLVAEHREHGRNMSDDAARMLRETLAVMREQRPYVKRDRDLACAYRDGVRNWKRYWGGLLVEQAGRSLRQRRIGDALRQAALLVRHLPTGLPRVFARARHPVA